MDQDMQPSGTVATSQRGAPRTADQYQYTPLQGNTGTRLLRFTNGPDVECMECTMELVSTDDLENGAPCIALSYCWGSGLRDQKIWIDRQQFLVSTDLLGALKMLRALSPQGPSTQAYWIDALCIQQTDLSEKSYQVRHIDRIFRHATKVIIWLGEATDHSAEVIYIIRWLYTMRRHTDNNAALSEDIETSITDLMAHLKDVNDVNETGLEELRGFAEEAGLFTESRFGGREYIDVFVVADRLRREGRLWPEEHWFWPALHRLLCRPWFSRVWTYQEVLLARRAEVRCGSASLPWEAMRIFKARISAVRFITALPATREMYRSLAKDIAGDTISMYLPQLLELDNSNDPCVLAVLLAGSEGRQCDDPRDYVYGIVGLLGPALRSRLVVDYNRPVAEVFTKAAQIAYTHRGGGTTWSLDVGRNARTADATTAGLPSWCPDFSASPGDFALSSYVSEAVQNRASDLKCTPTFRGLVFSVLGVGVDTVARVTITSPHITSSALLYSKRPVERHQAFALLFSARNICWFLEMCTVFQLSQSQWSAQCSAWVRYYFFKDHDIPENEMRVRITRIVRLFQGGPVLDRTSDVSLNRELVHNDSATQAVFWELVTDFFRATHNHRGNRVLLPTSGHVGLSPGPVEVGDRIDYFGGQYLHILSADQRTYKSVAVVHGYMGDALLDTVAKMEKWKMFHLQ